MLTLLKKVRNVKETQDTATQLFCDFHKHMGRQGKGLFWKCEFLPVAI